MKGTLKSRRAFQHIYDQGRRAIGQHVVVFAVPSGEVAGEQTGAVGIVASRKVGHSPDRSRAKRVLRAALRELRARRRVNGHAVLVARRSLIEDGSRSTEIARELEALLEQTGSLEGAAR